MCQSATDRSTCRQQYHEMVSQFSASNDDMQSQNMHTYSAIQRQRCRLRQVTCVGARGRVVEQTQSDRAEEYWTASLGDEENQTTTHIYNKRFTWDVNTHAYNKSGACCNVTPDLLHECVLTSQVNSLYASSSGWHRRCDFCAISVSRRRSQQSIAFVRCEWSHRDATTFNWTIFSCWFETSSDKLQVHQCQPSWDSPSNYC